MQGGDLQAIKQRFGIIGNNAALNRGIEVAVQVALTDLSVLITGESGVGKEHFPKIIHQHSARKHGPYFAINCGAIPEGTIDAELFGHTKGAFTDAKSERKGYFEIADGGTLFLDEVGELPLSTQARLLRVLETGEFIRMGRKDQRTRGSCYQPRYPTRYRSRSLPRRSILSTQYHRDQGTCSARTQRGYTIAIQKVRSGLCR